MKRTVAATAVVVLVSGIGPVVMAKSTGSTTITVDMTNPKAAPPKPVEVNDGDEVVLDIQRTLLQQCTVETKPEEIKPETSPLASILSLASKAVAGATKKPATDANGVVLAEPAEACPIPAVPAPVGDAEAIQLEATLRQVNAALILLRQNLADYQYGQPSLKQLSQDVAKLVRCVNPKTVTNACASVMAFDLARIDLVRDVSVFLERTPVPGSETAALELDGLKKALVARAQKTSNDAWLVNARARSDCYAAQLENLNDIRKSAVATREQLRAFVTASNAFSPADEDARHQLVSLRAYRSTKTTSTVTCINYFTKLQTVPSPQLEVDPRIDGVAVVVTFSTPARVAASGGVIYSTIGKLQYGTQQVKTGVDASGVDTFVTKIAETDRSGTQVIPFSFLHLRLTDPRPVFAYVTIGIGLNANNGSKQAEYFLGASCSVKNVYVSVGAHYGRIQEVANGFGLGDTVPDKVSAPVSRSYHPKLAVAVSYKLPLP